MHTDPRWCHCWRRWRSVRRIQKVSLDRSHPGIVPGTCESHLSVGKPLYKRPTSDRAGDIKGAKTSCTCSVKHCKGGKPQWFMMLKCLNEWMNKLQSQFKCQVEQQSDKLWWAFTRRNVLTLERRYAEPRSQRIPPVQYIRTFLFRNSSRFWST